MPVWFGPAGNEDAFAASGHKSSVEAPAYIAAMGLNAFEYQCGHGVRVGKIAASAFGKAAKEYNIRLSLHAPYYISLSGKDEEKRLGSLRYIMESAVAAKAMGADRIIIHSGSASGGNRAESLLLACDTLSRARAECDAAGFEDIIFCPETMGKINQLGDLDEVMTLCLLDERHTPCIDFGHLYARTLGAAEGYEATVAMLDTVENKLGRERAAKFHCHFSHIEYSKSGELRHTVIEDTAFGPDFTPLARLIYERELSPVIICESRGVQAADAARLMQIYKNLGEQKI